MDFERTKKPIKQISLIPLINVVFLLLIFFLVAGTVEKFEVIDVELPEAVSGEIVDEGHIQILLGQYDEIIINDKPSTLNEVLAEIESQLKYNKERVITVKADARMNASRLIAVLDRIKAAGGTNLSLVTQEL